MAYARSPPPSSGLQEDLDRRDHKMGAKTYSFSSRTNASQSRTQSIASTSSRAQNAAQYESSARIYYAELRSYLSSVIARENEEGASPQRISARQKLTRLSSLQFHELAMDVYDETCRRILNDKLSPFLPVKPEFHPRRNQARQKLATLTVPRFQDLASDVYYELIRRFPELGDDDASRRPPVPAVPNGINGVRNDSIPDKPPAKAQASHATNIIPVKGTINVEAVHLSDEEKDYMASRETGNGVGLASRSLNNGPSSMGTNVSSSGDGEGNFQSLDSLMADLGNMVSTKSSSESIATRSAYTDDHSAEPRNLGNGDRSGIEKMRSDYEYKLAAMTKRMQQLENESRLVRERQDSAQSEMEQDIAQLRKLEHERQSRLKQLQEEYNRLDDSHQQLEREHRELKNIVDEVKEDARQLLLQIKSLTSKNDAMRAEKEKSDVLVRQLTEEAKSWQAKYEKIRLELRAVRAGSLAGDDVPKQNIAKDAFLQPTSKGVVSHHHVVLYQTAVDHLLKTARSSQPSDVLLAMQTIVTACKKMSTDVESYESKAALSPSMQSNLNSLKSKLSTALTNLLTAAKNHANSMGISPVSLLDVSAGNLTVAVVDILKLVGMAPGKDDDDLAVTKEQNYIPPARSASRAADVMNPEVLAEYLRKETDNVVETIQNLLVALRSPSQTSQVYDIISSIIQIIVQIIQAVESTISSEGGVRFRKPTEIVLSNLEQCKQTLSDIRDTSFTRTSETASASVKRDLAKETYEIAKYTKELINIFDA